MIERYSASSNFYSQMSAITVEQVLEEAVSQIEKQVGIDEPSLIVERLKEFLELVRKKSLNNGRPRSSERNYTNITQKVDSISERRNLLRKKLRALQEYQKRELDFRTEIIKRNHALHNEREKQFKEVLTAERAMYEQEITLAKSAFQKREDQDHKSRIQEANLRLDESQTMNVITERERRKEWMQRKDVLQKILDEYDKQMSVQQNEFEFLSQLHEHETCELHRYKILCEEQDEPYCDLMREREEYLEGVRQQKLYEIRVKIAQRKIVKFVEQYYPIWKKKKLKAAKKKSKYKSRYGR